VEEAISEGLPPRLLVVRLRESDALLHAAAKKEATAREQKSLERALAEKRTRMDDIWNTHCREPQCLELKVENVELEGQAERNAKFLRSLRLADRVLNHIGEYFGLEVSKLRHSGFVRWRNAHGLT